MANEPTRAVRRSRHPMWAVCAFLAVAAAADAAEFVPVRDGDTVSAKVSIKDQTRIKLDKGRITEVIGDVYNKEKNPSGRLVVVPDDEDGEFYVRPIDVGTRPAKVDIKTDHGKFSLLLQPVDIPGDTLVLLSRGQALPPGTPQALADGQAVAAMAPLPAQPVGAAMPRNGAHVRALKAMTLAMAGAEVPADVEVRPTNQVVALWRESRFVLTGTFLSRELVGERYDLTNVSSQNMVIDEREFYRDGVQSVSVKYHQLTPGTATAVWIVRNRTSND